MNARWLSECLVVSSEHKRERNCRMCRRAASLILMSPTTLQKCTQHHYIPFKTLRNR